MKWAPALLTIVILHSAAGVEVYLNTDTVTNLRNPEPNHPHFTHNVKCLINMNDGKFVTVRETCTDVQRIMQGRYTIPYSSICISAAHAL